MAARFHRSPGQPGGLRLPYRKSISIRVPPVCSKALGLLAGGSTAMVDLSKRA